MGQTNFSRLKAGQRAHLAVPNVEAAVHGVRNSGPIGGTPGSYPGSDHRITLRPTDNGMATSTP